MANINWVECASGKFITKEEVGINLTGKKGDETVNISFDPGVYSTKMSNTNRMLVGYDDVLCRLYIVPCDDDMAGSYSVNKPHNNGRPKIQIRVIKFSQMNFPVSSLQGGYKLVFDQEERLWYVDVSQNVKFASKKIKTI